MPAFQHADLMTDAATVGRTNLKATIVGMAHFAGTGPEGKTCTSCFFFRENDTRKKMICHKYRQMTGDDKKAVPSGTLACRYYQMDGKI